MIKPPRTHHCSKCDRCILKMDHHCPWVGSCVGYDNHKVFVQFMIYVVIGCLFVGLSSGILCIRIMVGDLKTPEVNSIVGIDKIFWMSFTAIVALGFALSVSTLLITHLVYINKNLSSIERSSLAYVNPFNH